MRHAAHDSTRFTHTLPPLASFVAELAFCCSSIFAAMLRVLGSKNKRPFAIDDIEFKSKHGRPL
jgi:hypothetical protein